MRRKFPESKRCCGVFVLVAAFFVFAADFLECGGNLRRNALRQKFPPKEVLGMPEGPSAQVGVVEARSLWRRANVQSAR